MKRASLLSAIILLAAALAIPALAWACPFCSAVSQTFTEEINTVQVGVIAKLLDQPAAKANGDEPPAANVEKSKFEIVQVIKGDEHLKDKKQIEVLYFGQQPKGTKFLILGIDPPDVAWNAPVPLTDRAVEYIGKLLGLPEKGAARLAFFQDYLEDKDELLARDAYDEFAKAPYSEVKELKDQIHHEKILQWIQDKNVLASRRRLYLTMLGVCGSEKDVQMLEGLITREEPDGEPKSALDAMIACYLTLKGPEGMKLVEDEFLKNPKAEYTDTYSAIMALRFHGQEEQIIPKERLVEGLRYMLDRPQLADLVIPDLARWQDWGSMDKLVKLFKESDDKTSWVRVPVVQFLKACPLPEAKDRVAELEKIDPESVKRASFFVGYAAGASSGATAAGDSKTTVAKVPAPEAGKENVKEKEKDKEKVSVKDVAVTAEPPKPVADTKLDEPAKKQQELEQQPVAAVTPPAGPTDSGTPPSQTPPGNKPVSPAEASNSLWIVFVPLVVGIVLLALLILIVRGGVGRMPTEAKS